jgi:putative endonuclease
MDCFALATLGVATTPTRTNTSVIARSAATKQSMSAWSEPWVASALPMTVECPRSPHARAPCVYIMASKRNGTLYTGVTSNLAQRAYQHRESLTPGFASRYGCKLLVWYETHERMDHAIGREKQIKGGSRATKIALIQAMNPEWSDLYESLA